MRGIEVEKKIITKGSKILIENINTNTNEMGFINFTINKFQLDNNQFVLYFETLKNKFKDSKYFDINVVSKKLNKYNLDMEKKFKHSQIKLDFNVDYKTIDINERDSISTYLSLNDKDLHNFNYFLDKNFQKDFFTNDFFLPIQEKIYNSYYNKCIETYSIIAHKDCSYYANIYVNELGINSTNAYITKIEPIMTLLNII